MLKLEARPEPSRAMSIASPLIALAITVVYGPWKDPAGYNFPQTITFLKSTQVPKLFAGFRVNLGAPLSLVAVALFWVLLFRTYAGFQLQVGGLAPAAARYAGFRRAAPCGRRCCSPAAWLVWPAGSRWRGRSARPAMPPES